MKKGYEVIATRPICVDFEDGRVVSYRPQMRFHADHRNRSVSRALRRREVRELTSYEPVPVLPVALGTPPDEAALLKARHDIAQRKKVARLRVAQQKKQAITSKAAAATAAVVPVDLSKMNVPVTESASKKRRSKTDSNRAEG